MKLMIATVLLSIASFVLSVVAANAMLIDAQVGAAIAQIFSKEKRTPMREVPKNFQTQSSIPK